MVRSIFFLDEGMVRDLASVVTTYLPIYGTLALVIVTYLAMVGDMPCYAKAR